MKKHAQKRSSNMIRFCHFQSWGMWTIAMDFVWWVSAKCRNCFWPWDFLNRWLECTLFLMSQLSDCEEHSYDTLFCALALMCILNCLLHINLVLAHCSIVTMLWSVVSPVSIQYQQVILYVSQCTIVMAVTCQLVTVSEAKFTHQRC